MPIKIMSKLRQCHPNLRVLQIKQTKNDWIFIGDTSKDFAILQSEPKMQQVLGKKVKMSLPRSYHSADAKKDKILVFKGVSNNITIEDFKQLLDFNKITHAKAERMKSKRTGKDLPFIKIKSDDPKQAKALISGGLIGQKTGIIFKVKEFRITPSIQQCFKCQGFRHKAQNCTKKQRCVVSGEAHSHKDCPNRNKKTPKCANCREPHVANYRGCHAYKDQPFRWHVVQNQIFYASIVKQASPPPPNNTFNFTAEQIVSLVTNVVLQIAQPQLCTKNLPEKQVRAKSDLSKQIPETAKKCLGVNIQGKDVFESIISQPAPPPLAPFVFSSTLGQVEIILFIGMNIVFWNCQGLRPKWKELQNYLLENQINILALNETFLKPRFKFHLPGYDIYKNDRLVGTKDGVAILVKKASL